MFYYMSNLDNLQGVVIRKEGIVTLRDTNQTRNLQTIDSRDACFCEESVIDRSFVILRILRRNTDS